MDVFVNEKPVSIFEGAKVHDVLVKFGLGKAEISTTQVFDENGNRIEKDGALLENQKLYLKQKDQVTKTPVIQHISRILKSILSIFNKSSN